MSRYYCENCKSELMPSRSVSFDETHQCPHCMCPDYTIRALPDYETPEQYEKRTGKKWNGAVWRKHKGASQESTGWIAQRFTGNLEYFYLLCAQSPDPPSDDWKQGEGIS